MKCEAGIKTWKRAPVLFRGVSGRTNLIWRRFVVLFALVATIGFSTISCDNEEDDQLLKLLILAYFLQQPSCVSTTSPQCAIQTSAGGDLRITEVKNCVHWDQCWVEVANMGTEAKNLRNYRLRSPSQMRIDPYTYFHDTTFSLPDQQIEPGEFFTIHSSMGIRQSTDQVLYLDPGNNTFPLYGNGGYVELQTASGDSVDFVRFGSSSDTPASGSFTGATPFPQWTQEEAWYSIVRDCDSTDTDSGSDWSMAKFVTSSAPNDVSCGEDADLDGIPDCSEAQGKTFRGLDFYAMGARPDQSDIFYEVDYMKSDDFGMKPNQRAMELLASKFLEQEYTVHFDAGNYFDGTTGSCVNPSAHNLGQGSGEVSFFQNINLSSGEDSSQRYHDIYMDRARHTIFRYAVYVYSDWNGNRSGGNGWIGSAVGFTQLQFGELYSSYNEDIIVRDQYTLMFHEFGHTLGLGHGGGEGPNYKPNYKSIMNYLYNYHSAESDPYDYYAYSGCDLYNRPDHLYSGTYADVLTYSQGGRPSIDENHVNETLGADGTGTYPIDYNCNGTYETDIAFDLNQDGTFEILNDGNDWNNLIVPLAGPNAAKKRTE